MVIERGTLALTWVDRRTLGYDARKQWGGRTKTFVLDGLRAKLNEYLGGDHARTLILRDPRASCVCDSAIVI